MEKDTLDATFLGGIEMVVQAGPLLGEGKTKWIHGVAGHPGLCILKAKNAVTKNDDPDATVTLEGKDVWSTATTCASFRLLKKAGLPVAYRRRLSHIDILAPLCRMIPLECIARRVAEGSYCKRNPAIKKGYRFDRLKIEFFAKTTAGSLQPFNGDDRIAIMPPNPANKDNRPDDDPLITNPYEAEWVLAHSKTAVAVSMGLPSTTVLPEGVTIAQLEELTRKAFLVLEKGWAALGWPMSDFKIEFGVDSKGRLYIADVVDADSWRLYDNKGNPMSKQIWRDNEPLEKLAGVYRKVAKMAQRLRAPNQAIILWKTAEIPHCDFTEINKTPGINFIDVRPGTEDEDSFGDLQKYMIGEHAEGGVIIAAGSSLSMATRLARFTTWPIIDLQSSHLAPPMLCTGPMGSISGIPGAIEAAMRILSISNPALYMRTRYKQEMDMK